MSKLHKKWAKFNAYLKGPEITWNRVIRSIVYVICSAVMFYQVSFSCIEYYNYKTVVEIKIAKSDEIEMPSITVCKQMNTKEYLNSLRKSDKEFAELCPEINELKSQQNKNLNNETEEQVIKEELDALKNVSQYFEIEDRDANTFFDIMKDHLKVECMDLRSGTGRTCDQTQPAINSFTQKRICRTFFSKILSNMNESENSFNISEDNSTEKEENSERVFAYLQIDNPLNDIFIYIHTSKSMPDINLYDIEMSPIQNIL